MRKVMILTAAGYKGVATMFPDVPYLCPEPLLPIGEKYGNTILERLAKQYSRLGFEIFVSVAGPEYVYSWRPAWNAKHFKFRHDPAAVLEAPWTQERIDDVARYATPIIVPDPDKTNYHDSAFIILDQIGYDWDQCLITQGDHLYTDGITKSIAALPFPCQIRPSFGGRAFTVLSLTPLAAKKYRHYGEPWRAARRHKWNGGGSRGTYGYKPAGHEFGKFAPVVFVTDVLPQHSEWECCNDVDSPRSYTKALIWLDEWCS